MGSREQEEETENQNGERKRKIKMDNELVMFMLHPMGPPELPTIIQELKGGGYCPSVTMLFQIASGGVSI